MDSSNLIQDVDISNIRVEAMGFVQTAQFLKELGIDDNVKHGDIGRYIYRFKIQLPKHFWIIRRRVSDFMHLEKAVRHDPFYMFKHKKIHKETKESDPFQMQHELFAYLNQVLNESHNNPCLELLRFLEISHIKYGSARKFKECFLKKKAGGRFSESRCARCGTLWGRWSSRYFCITSEAVMYSKGHTGQSAKVREVLNFDYNLKILQGKLETGHERGITLKFSTRILVLIAPDMYTFIDFLYSLKEAINESPYTTVHQFDSFAPIRQSKCQWYVDGHQYFSDVMDAILSAKASVYITDWWLSPDFYLRRPISKNEDDLTNKDSRLDIVLKNVADRGVAVCIIVYEEPTMALNNDSLHTKTHLEQLSNNIQVMRHPSVIIPSKWSHHEKMVVIDQSVGFMGGLDICFGRMDTQSHHLQDSQEGMQFWPGIDYSNSRKKDFYNVKFTQESLIERTQPRMPWHDIAIRINGESVIDMVRHFVQYWNHIIVEQNFKQKNQQFNKQVSLLHTGGHEKQTDYTKISDMQTNRESFIEFKGGHFQNYIKKIEQEVKEVEEQEQQEQQQFEKKEMQIDLQQETLLPSIRRVSSIYPGKKTINKEAIQLMKSLKPIVEESDHDQGHVNDYKRLPTIKHDSQHAMLQFITQSATKGSCETQLLRSASNWSIGCSTQNCEFSIQLAYLHLIGEAKNYIYIENQFFISSTADYPVENKIAKALISRIKQAAMINQPFKVVVFIPLLPGFEGEIDDGTSAVLKIQLHWEYATINRGYNSIIETLRKDVHIQDRVSEYIEFYSLRTHAAINGVPHTEQIYIHSKLMIIDDEIALIGSANINDRSLLGNRDSELAIVVHDSNKVPSQMGGIPTLKSSFAYTLRSSLYQEHFALSESEVSDPLDPQLAQQIRQQTSQNTEIYRFIFACYPDDNITSIAEYAKFKKTGNIDLYTEESPKIIGHAVQFPLQFLKDENLKIGVFNKEYLVPEINFT